MFSSLFTATILITGALAARPFVEWPDTGLEDVVKHVKVGTLPNLEDMIGLNDFQWAAKNYLPIKNYTYYRSGAGGEYSYRNNLEVYNRYALKPRVMNDITDIESSLNTTILGYKFSNPFFISPAARADYGHPDAELNIMKAAVSSNTLYIVSNSAAKPIDEIADVIPTNSSYNFFRQLYTSTDDAKNQALFDESEKVGAKAFVWPVDSAGHPSRERSIRFNVNSAVTSLQTLDWAVYNKFRNMTKLPIILKGIQSAADARTCVQNNVPAIILSNHGGRNLDGSRSSLEVALEIYNTDRTIFDQIEVYADGGVRYGTDALRLLALGVRAVGLGRPIMFSNVFGEEGIAKALDLLRNQVMSDAANLGVSDLKQINASYVEWTPNYWYS